MESEKVQDGLVREPLFVDAIARGVPVIVYTVGPCYASACVLRGTSLEAIEATVNIEHPTGIDSRWAVSKRAFADGSPNPTVCPSGEPRDHYLLEC